MRSILTAKLGILAKLAKRVVAAASGTVRQTSNALRLQGTSNTGTLTLTAIAENSGIIIGASTFVGLIGSVVGSLNGAYTKAISSESEGFNSTEIWYKLGSIAGNETITITTTSSVGESFVTAQAVEVTGVTALDKTGSATHTNSVVADAANAQARQFVMVGAIYDSSGNAGFSAPSGYTLLLLENDSDNYSACVYAWKVTSSIETSGATVTATASASTDMAIATFGLS